MCARELGLHARQRPRECVGLGPREVLEERAELFGQQRVGARERPLAGTRERQREPAAVLRAELTLDEARVLERRQQLRDRRAGDAGAPRELRAGYALALDRPQGEVLRDGQRRIALGEQPLYPPRCKGRYRGECLDGFVSIRAWWWGNR
jgi:hypothetical protein